MNLLIKKSLVIILMALLTACAALQIDVDVYKGPLSDQRDVQHEQLISLVVTSKKLLDDLQRQLLKGLSFNEEDHIVVSNKDNGELANGGKNGLKSGVTYGALNHDFCYLMSEKSWHVEDDVVNKEDIINRLGLACNLLDLSSLFNDEINEIYLYIERIEGVVREYSKLGLSVRHDDVEAEPDLNVKARKLIDKGVYLALELLSKIQSGNVKFSNSIEVEKEIARELSKSINPIQLERSIDLIVGSSRLNKSMSFSAFNFSNETSIAKKAKLVERYLVNSKNSAETLLNVRNEIRANCEIDEIRGKFERLCESGFARGISRDGDNDHATGALANLNDLRETRFYKSSPRTLTESRLPEGIFKLERQLRNAKIGDDEEKLRDDLYAMLLNYAGKLLVLSDKQVLLTEGSKKELRTSAQYTQVLQSFGSAIYVQINELKAQSKHKKLQQEMDKQDVELAEQFFGRNPANFKRNVLQKIKHDQSKQVVLQTNVESAKKQLVGWRENYQKLASRENDKRRQENIQQSLQQTLQLISNENIIPIADTGQAFKDATLALLKHRAQENNSARQQKECADKTEDFKQGCSLLQLTITHIESQPATSPYFGSSTSNKEERLFSLKAELTQRYNKVKEYLSELTTDYDLRNEEHNNAIKALAALLSSEVDAKTCIENSECDQLDTNLRTVNSQIEKLQNALSVATKATFTVGADPSEWISLIIGSEKGGHVDYLKSIAEQIINKSVIAGFDCPGKQDEVSAKCEPGYALKGVVHYLESQIIYLRSIGDKENLDHVKNALQLAHDLSARRQYLTPATAYLRSSYPSSALQRNNSASDWQNMLMRGALRTIPIISKAPGLTQENPVQQQIDKQFWQNINTVRITGGGNTNYVVVKDDIGNWYVKGYSSDPEQIYKTVANVALYNSAGKAGYLLDQGNGTLSLKGSANVLDAMYGRFFEKYVNTTESQFNTLKSWLDNDSWLEYAEKDCKEKSQDEKPVKKLKEFQGSDSMKLHKDKFDSLTKMFKQISSPDNKVNADQLTTQRADAIIQLLSGTADYANSLLITAREKCDPSNALDTSVGVELYDHFVEKHKKQRQESLDDFAQQILLIREGLPENSQVQAYSLD